MSTKAQYRNGLLTYYESDTLESSLPVSPVFFEEEFLRKAIDTTTIWTALDTSAAGNTTPALVADAPNGVVSTMLDATNEVQLSGLTWGDQRTLVLNQGLVFEARIKLATLPTGAVACAVGLCGDHNAAIDTVAESAWFRFDGGGAITVETDDTVHETSKVATGITLLNTDWAVLRIECQDITSVRFFVNGNQVATGTAFNMSQVAALALQPVVRIGKEGAAASVGTLYTDYIRCWQKRA